MRGVSSTRQRYVTECDLSDTAKTQPLFPINRGEAVDVACWEEVGEAYEETIFASLPKDPTGHSG